MNATAAWLFVTMIVVAVAGVNAAQEHPEFVAVLFLALWDTAPVATVTASIWFFRRGGSRTPISLSVAGAFCGASSLLVFLIGVARGAPDPDTAGHMAAFLWPPLIGFASLVVLVTTGVILRFFGGGARENRIIRGSS